MKKIIAVSGTRNVGKTKSIKMVPDLLKEEFSVEEKIIKGGVDIIIKIKINGVIIIIASAGDKEEILETLFDIIGEEWDILVCATKTYGKTTIFIETKVQKVPSSKIVWISKKPSLSEDNVESENKKTAQEILNHIREQLPKTN